MDSVGIASHKQTNATVNKLVTRHFMIGWIILNSEYYRLAQHVKIS